MAKIENSQPPSGPEKKKKSLFRRRRGGNYLSKEEVREIKQGRKELKAEMKARGIYSKKEFEMAASSMGLYFDKAGLWAFLLWLFAGKGLWLVLGATVLLLAAVFAASRITQLKGHFTINMSADMFREGFALSETADFSKATTYLFCEPAVDVPCISITDLPRDLDTHEGQQNANYFSYTFFLRNEGQSTVDYRWKVHLNSESQNLSDACWVMVFEDGKMVFCAAPDAQGRVQALPAMDDNTRGYLSAPLLEAAKYPEKQYEIITQKGPLTYYRLIPFPFESADVVLSGYQSQVAPGDTHRYTVVIWLEGDDPDCTNDMIGGHAGMEMEFELVEPNP